MEEKIKKNEEEKVDDCKEDVIDSGKVNKIVSLDRKILKREIDVLKKESFILDRLCMCKTYYLGSMNEISCCVSFMDSKNNKEYRFSVANHRDKTITVLFWTNTYINGISTIVCCQTHITEERCVYSISDMNFVINCLTNDIISNMVCVYIIKRLICGYNLYLMIRTKDKGTFGTRFGKDKKEIVTINLEALVNLIDSKTKMVVKFPWSDAF